MSPPNNLKKSMIRYTIYIYIYTHPYNKYILCFSLNVLILYYLFYKKKFIQIFLNLFCNKIESKLYDTIGFKYDLV